MRHGFIYLLRAGIVDRTSYTAGWRDPPLLGSADDLGTLADLGFGLRLGNMRSALANVLHLDVAVPLQVNSSMRDVQFLVQTNTVSERT
jgi:hypothetical protein